MGASGWIMPYDTEVVDEEEAAPPTPSPLEKPGATHSLATVSTPPGLPVAPTRYLPGLSVGQPRPPPPGLSVGPTSRPPGLSMGPTPPPPRRSKGFTPFAKSTAPPSFPHAPAAPPRQAAVKRSNNGVRRTKETMEAFEVRAYMCLL